MGEDYIVKLDEMYQGGTMDVYEWSNQHIKGTNTLGFYVYQYAVGISAACNIADCIQSGEEGAVEDYLAFLKAGDSGNAVELFKLAGVDITNGDYINAFTERFERLTAEFEEK